MTYTKLHAIGQLLSCYFHQDWVDEFENDETALQSIINFEPREQILASLKEIDELLLLFLTEDELKSIIIDKLGCYFDPVSIGMTYRQWLESIHRKFMLAI